MRLAQAQLRLALALGQVQLALALAQAHLSLALALAQLLLALAPAQAQLLLAPPQSHLLPQLLHRRPRHTRTRTRPIQRKIATARRPGGRPAQWTATAAPGQKLREGLGRLHQHQLECH